MVDRCDSDWFINIIIRCQTWSINYYWFYWLSVWSVWRKSTKTSIEATIESKRGLWNRWNNWIVISWNSLDHL